MAGSLYIAYVILNVFTDVIYNKRYIFFRRYNAEKMCIKGAKLKNFPQSNTNWLEDIDGPQPIL